jgi:3',5'-cyclic-AMP phosphodiesterase
MSVQMNRRDLIKAGAALGAASLTGATLAVPSRVIALAPRRSLRLAHLTDVHVQKAKAGGEGFAACLKHVQSRPDKPELILFGGDNVMNVDGGGRDSAREQLDVWKSVLKNDCSLPYLVAVGNHDVFANHPVDGKKWAEDAYALPKRYYSFDCSGWRFFVLDSTAPGAGGYKGRLDDEQFDWLERTLRDTPATTHICVLSHIPILGVCTFFDGQCEKTGDWVVPGSWMHIDARRIKDLFRKHQNVKLCLSGHIHLADVVTYLGVTYACNGAVSGAWWDGFYHEFDAGYALVDLFDDGTLNVEFVTYGWKPRA